MYMGFLLGKNWGLHGVCTAVYVHRAPYSPLETMHLGITQPMHEIGGTERYSVGLFTPWAVVLAHSHLKSAINCADFFVELS